MEEFPPLVAQANALARHVGFALTKQEAGGDGSAPSCCLPGVGRVLAVLASGCHGGRIGEIGTGVGVGSAWMASAMPADCTLVTVEIDRDRAAHATSLLASDGRVRVLTGDAGELIPTCAPYDLLFADGGRPDRAGYAALVDLLLIGGQLVADDVTPLATTPAGSPVLASDVKRNFFFGEPRLVSTEIVLPDLRNSLLIGTRLA
ncbi:MAG TPA: class I SAM-dependent methyltransferase [Streptosporangiaceae bacterium]|nr:class I SAM-dependent methyltransferase [Streptosporangiaceae bacterium]